MAFLRISWFRQRRGGRRPEAKGPLHYSTLRHRSDEEWRAALAKSPAEAARWIYAAACGGESQAMLLWAQILLDGNGAARDPEAALRWFQIAANAGNVDGANMAGRCYECGWGTKPDPAEAARWFRRAADRGHGWAQYNLGMLVLEGRGTARDPRAALSLFVRSARQGNAKAMTMIGLGLEEGWSGRCDPAAARRWYRRAARRGCFRGAFHKARLLIVDGRKADAAKWFKASISAAPPAFCAGMAPSLLARPEPEIRALGRQAQLRGKTQAVLSAIMSALMTAGVVVAE